MNKIKNIDFYGLKLSIFSKNQLRENLYNYIVAGQKKVCFGYSFGYLPWFKKYPKLYEYANQYDVMVTDGRQFYLFAKFLGAPLLYDISIPFISNMLMELANEHKFSMMIIGSDSETNIRATENVKKKYPNAIVFEGYSGGDFSEEAQRETVKIINKNSPDIIFVGVSSPKKEIFSTRCKDELNVKIIVPFGGMIDGLSGKVWLTPPLLKKLGFATLIRVIQEPKRLLWLNIWIAYETFLRIIPKTIWEVKIKKNKNFFLPSIYNIKRIKGDEK